MLGRGTKKNMVRGPCCEKMGLRKGPWSAEEDMILVSYIQRYGHGNWRMLPKQAGLLRCGKSCRLRWTNYLRPDIKRGNFSVEEEETIIRLHQALGNRWSAIAARLPGRTDNEIKNVWNTHLKKRLNLRLKPQEQKYDATTDQSSMESSFSGMDSPVVAEQKNDFVMVDDNFFELNGWFWPEGLSLDSNNSSRTELLYLQDDYDTEFFLKTMEKL